MNYITTTQLRTETPELILALTNGQSVDLIHRSQVIGEVRPKKVAKTKLFNSQRMMKIVESMNLKPMTIKQAEKNYRNYMFKRHGQGIS